MYFGWLASEKSAASQGSRDAKSSYGAGGEWEAIKSW